MIHSLFTDDCGEEKKPHVNNIFSLKEKLLFYQKKKKRCELIWQETYIAAEHIDQKKKWCEWPRCTIREKEKLYENDPRIPQTETEVIHIFINILHT